MKHSFINKQNIRLIAIFSILLIAFIIHSCKKDNTGNKNIQQPGVLNASMLNMAKQWYNTTYAPANGAGKLATQSIGSGPNAWNQTFIPYWDKANTYTLDSLGYIELPALKRGDMAMSYKSINASSFNFGKPQSLTSLIIVNKNGNFYMYAMTILADSSYLNGDYTKLAKNTYRNKDNNFSGNVYYHRMDGSFVNGWRFQNGVVTGIITLAPPGTPTGPATQNKNNPVVDVAQVVDCQTTTTTTYWEQCSYYTNDYADAHPFNCFDYTTEDSYTTCTTQSSGPGGGSSAPPPCTPPSGGSSDPPSVDVSKYRTLVADPNPPNGGNPPGGIVDQNNQIGTNECITPTAPVDTSKDPCKQKAAVIARAVNSVIVAQNKTILSNTISNGIEYGADQNLTRLTGNTYVNTAITPGTRGGWSPSFTWNSTDGYTLGYSHGHPGGTGPSPADVFSLVQNLTNLALTSAGKPSLQFYENNAQVTTETATGNYIITITNWPAMQNLLNSTYSTQAEQDTLDSEFGDDGGDYLSDHPLATDGDAAADALMTLFSGEINIYYAPSGSTNYQPLIINSSTGTDAVATRNC